MRTFHSRSGWGKHGSVVALKTLQLVMAIAVGISTWYFLAPYASYFTRQLFEFYRYLFLETSYDWTVSGFISWAMAKGTSSHAAHWAYDNAPYVLTGVMSLAGYKVTGLMRPFIEDHEKEVAVTCMCPESSEVKTVPVAQAKEVLATRKRETQGLGKAAKASGGGRAALPKGNTNPSAEMLAAADLTASVENNPENSANVAAISAPTQKEKRLIQAQKRASEIEVIVASEDELAQLRNLMSTPSCEVAKAPIAAAPLVQFSINDASHTTKSVSCQIMHEGLAVTGETQPTPQTDKKAEQSTEKEAGKATSEPTHESDLTVKGAVEAQTTVTTQAREKRSRCVIS